MRYSRSMVHLALFPSTFSDPSPLRAQDGAPLGLTLGPR